MTREEWLFRRRSELRQVQARAAAAVSAAPRQLPPIKQIIRSTGRTRRTSLRVVPSSSNQSYQRLIAGRRKNAPVNCRVWGPSGNPDASGRACRFNENICRWRGFSVLPNVKQEASFKNTLHFLTALPRVTDLLHLLNTLQPPFLPIRRARLTEVSSAISSALEMNHKLLEFLSFLYYIPSRKVVAMGS